jgi:hypothetical protein
LTVRGGPGVMRSMLARRRTTTPPQARAKPARARGARTPALRGEPRGTVVTQPGHPRQRAPRTIGGPPARRPTPQARRSAGPASTTSARRSCPSGSSRPCTAGSSSSPGSRARPRRRCPARPSSAGYPTGRPRRASRTRTRPGGAESADRRAVRAATVIGGRVGERQQRLQRVGCRKNSDDFIAVADRQRPDLSLEQQSRRLRERRLGGDGDRIFRHDTTDRVGEPRRPRGIFEEPPQVAVRDDTRDAVTVDDD